MLKALKDVLEEMVTTIDSPAEQATQVEDVKDYLIRMFEESPIRHGQRFDNQTRWCEVCNSTKSPVEVNSDNWLTKMCKDCQAVWPEHIEEFLYKCQTEEDFLSQFPVNSIN